MPLVSIIVPVYNAQSHLSRCLESICGQEYKNLELIVINDGSKDKSLPVCEEFRKKDSRILLVDKANSGVSDTRNLGLKPPSDERSSWFTLSSLLRTRHRWCPRTGMHSQAARRTRRSGSS